MNSLAKVVPLPFKGQMTSACAIFGRSIVARILCSHVQQESLGNSTQVARNTFRQPSDRESILCWFVERQDSKSLGDGRCSFFRATIDIKLGECCASLAA